MARARSQGSGSGNPSRRNRPAPAPAAQPPRGATPGAAAAAAVIGAGVPRPAVGGTSNVAPGPVNPANPFPQFFIGPMAQTAPPPSAIGPSQRTGRKIIALQDDGGAGGGAALASKAFAALANRAGVKTASIVRQSDYGNKPIEAKTLREARGVCLDELGVMVVDADPDTEPRIHGLAAASDSPIRIVEDELFVWPLQPIRPQFFFWPFQGQPGPGTPQSAYMEGFRDAAEYLYRRMGGTAGPAIAPGTVAGLPVAPGAFTGAQPGGCFADNESFTWNLQAVGIPGTTFTGAGVGLAILDTGINENHPDLSGRIADSASFTGDPVADVHGHGTHCAGTAAGQQPAQGPRYGVAPSADLLIGKVLGDNGFGVDRGIFAGIAWAVRNRCAVISMSLGSVAPPSRAYELAARRAMRRGSLIIAAAGNESDRPRGRFAPVTRPANAPSILAVGALDPCLRIADFSCRGTSERGGGVDLAAPGVDILSAWVDPARYNVISGTSMATPLVAGIACLYAQARGVSGFELWQAVVSGARRIEGPAADFGAGLPKPPAPEEG